MAPRYSGVGPKPTTTTKNNLSIGLKEDPSKPYVDFDNKPYHEFYPIDLEYVIKKDETSEEQEFVDQSNLGSSNSANQGPSLKLIDWDSDENFERRLMREIFEDRKQRQQKLTGIEMEGRN